MMAFVLWMLMAGQHFEPQQYTNAVMSVAPVFECRDETVIIGEHPYTLRCAASAKTEPQDVPAIQEKYLAHRKGDKCFSTLMACEYATDDYELRWTCKDKSRILLIAEDDTKHCIKF